MTWQTALYLLGSLPFGVGGGVLFAAAQQRLWGAFAVGAILVLIGLAFMLAPAISQWFGTT